MRQHVDYLPWPEQGCSLAQARDRLTRAAVSAPAARHKPPARWIKYRAGADNRVAQTMFETLAANLLVGYGTTADKPCERIPAITWKGQLSVDWRRSSITSNELTFKDIKVFPVLLAPCRLDMLDGCPLSYAFKTFVLRDPEVEVLGCAAIEAAPEFERLFKHGWCFVRGGKEWPVMIDGGSRSLAIHSRLQDRGPVGWLGTAHPMEAVIACDALLHRVGALLGLLRRGELQAYGLPASPHYSEIIPSSVWLHPEFRFTVDGDLAQFNKECTDLFWDRLKRQWTAIALREAHKAVASTHVKHTEHDHLRQNARRSPKSGMVLAAIQQAGIDPRRTQLGPKAIEAKIAQYLPRPPEGPYAVAKMISRILRKARS